MEQQQQLVSNILHFAIAVCGLPITLAIGKSIAQYSLFYVIDIKREQYFRQTLDQRDNAYMAQGKTQGNALNDMTRAVGGILTT